MDEENFLRGKKAKKRPLARLFLIAAAVLAGFFGVYGLVRGFEIQLGFFDRLSATVSRSLGDVFGNSGGRKLAAEINLQSGNGEGAAAITGGGHPAITDKFAEEPQLQGVVPVSSSAEDGVTLESVKTSAVSEIAKNADEKNNVGDPASANNIYPVSNETVSAKKISEKNIVSPTCSFAAGKNPTRKILINEIAWMGSPPTAGETAAQAGNNEWFELKNNSGETVDLAGWQILSQDEKLKILFNGGEKIKSGQFYLLERTDDNSVPKILADKIYSGAFSNSGEWLRVFDGSCGLMDEINATSGWPGGDNGTKQTLERNAGDFSWHTSSAFGGTPKAENSVPQTAVASSPPSPNTSGQSDKKYILAVSMQGSGSGMVTSAPTGIRCGFDCFEEYLSGTSVNLTAAPENNSVFDNWSGACAGKGDCAVSVTKEMSAIANFTSLSPSRGSTYVPSVSDIGSVSNPAAPGHLVIATVQIAGAAANNDFIKIYNPTKGAVDINGWKLRKKTSSGADYSIRVFPSALSLVPSAYFAWANSDNDFALQISANVSSTQTLAANNSIALMNADGAIIDALAWGTELTNPYTEGSPYPDNPAANQILKRKFSGGVIQDTDNNSQDFGIQ